MANSGTVGSRLRATRLTRGMSLKQVAAAMGVDKSTVSYWESDRMSPNAKRLVSLARLYGISIDTILGRLYENDSPVASEPAEAAS